MDTGAGALQLFRAVSTREGRREPRTRVHAVTGKSGDGADPGGDAEPPTQRKKPPQSLNLL